MPIYIGEGITGHEFSYKLEIFGIELISIVHEFDVLFPDAVLYGFWHLCNSQCRIYNQTEMSYERFVRYWWVKKTYTKIVRCCSWAGCWVSRRFSCKKACRRSTSVSVSCNSCVSLCDRKPRPCNHRRNTESWFPPLRPFCTQRPRHHRICTTWRCRRFA